MSFEQFWTDKRIPPEMKRCGKPPVRKALAKTGANHEEILESLPKYAENKPDWQDFCHLSTYINNERHEVDWEETSVQAPHTPDRTKLTVFIGKGIWKEDWPNRPESIEEARRRLEALGAYGMDEFHKLKVVK